MGMLELRPDRPADALHSASVSLRARTRDTAIRRHLVAIEKMVKSGLSHGFHSMGTLSCDSRATAPSSTESLTMSPNAWIQGIPSKVLCDALKERMPQTQEQDAPTPTSPAWK